jgi:hypothetical protein
MDLGYDDNDNRKNKSKSAKVIFEEAGITSHFF